MRKKNTEIRIIEGIEIIDIAEEGKGVGKADDMVYFVEKAVPGDVVSIRQLRKKKNFAEGVIENLERASEFRTKPFCEHFGTCGGCKWQHMDYDAQLRFKQRSVGSALERLGKVDTSRMEPILGAPQNTYYRNKLEFTFSNKRWLDNNDMGSDQALQLNALGFHVPLRFDKILDINHCWLQDEPSNSIRNKVRAYALEHELSFYDLRNHEGALRNLIIRTASTGEVMVAVVFAYASPQQIDGLMAFLKAEFPHITSLLYIENQKKNDTIFDQEVVLYAGRDHIFEKMIAGQGNTAREIRFKIGVKSFYQTNSEQAWELYKITREFAGFTGNELVYDLYTGAGTIANFVAADVKHVVGIEYVPTAIEDAKFNSALNGIDNTTFYAGDMKDILTKDFISQHGKPDVVITDPPRAGMHADVVARLLEMESPRIVYVSCNAATQARDLALLAEKYDVVRIRPVDMFPHTQHVENVVLLELKTGEVIA
ncbi:23S rRNA (uracil(1939)-C(5))-methyltransferase RlmD [Pedobacter sp. SYP-B3415]|uniref:23S rRNA (uracil(1939)-C(5))-methyltransferase RlmD n=1 Tax=Pedobacter sp. SYP-B3415 TaxID=2496641 RepID=UPI00101D6509|nr:23S rRNA (uracil(1939)-C(5))-methyltransferase RlmD [Pedobacter sp. SYP-B3415]